MNNFSRKTAHLSEERRQLLNLLFQEEQVTPVQNQIIPRRSSTRPNHVPLSFAQEQLWFLEHLIPGNVFYNIPVVIHLIGHLKIGALEQSLHELIRRHEILRTTFITVEEGYSAQIIAPSGYLKLRIVDLQNISEDDRTREIQRLSSQEAQNPFDLKKEILLRVTLLHVEKEKHVLLMTMHHIISDDWSLEVCQRELAVHYKTFSEGQVSQLPDLPIQYADFAEWQRQWMQSEAAREQFAYWQQQLADMPEQLNLPTDRTRALVSTNQGAIASLSLPTTLFSKLKGLSQQKKVSLYMTLLAAFNVLLYRYTIQDDIVVGTASAGRNYRETEDLIGFFVNMLVLRTDLSGNPTFHELLQRVREVVLSAFSNQDFPFEQLVERLQPKAL